MKLRHIALAATLSAITVGTCAAPTPAQLLQGGTHPSAPVSDIKNAIKKKESAYRKTFSDCMNAASGVTIDTMNCINEEFTYQDRRLNFAYQALHGVLSPAKWVGVRDEQRKWLAERDICEMDNDIEGGTAEMLIRADCALRKTAFRADELEMLLKQQSH